MRRSRKLHTPWVKAPATAAAFRAFVRKRQTRVSYLIRERGSRALFGVANVSEIVRGAFHSAYLGYYVFAPFQGRGLMAEGLRLVIGQAFGRLRLHRLEANIQPGNARSRRLVRRLGFRREGYSPRYLKVGGRWRDHERWALVADEYNRAPCRPSTSSRRSTVRK